MKESHSSKIAVTPHTYFCNIPGEIPLEILREVASTAPSFTWPHDHPAFIRGQVAAFHWAATASIREITRVADKNGPAPTYVAITAGHFDLDEIDTLCVSDAAYWVAKILDIKGKPEATEANVEFEAGFHLTVEQIHDELIDAIEIKTEI